MEKTISLLCEGFVFAIPESTAKESPVLSQLIESLPEAPIRVIPITDFDLDAVNCFVEFLNTRSYEVNRTLFPSVVESAGTGKPPQDGAFTRDLLLRHAIMNTLGHHYNVSGLFVFARHEIQKILRSHWTDGAFLSVLNVALTHPDDYGLHEVLWSQSRSHLHSLTATSEFDPATFLRSFHSSLRTCPPICPTMTDSAEVERLKQQVTILQKRASEIYKERDSLQVTTKRTALILEKAEKDTEVARLEALNASTEFEQASKQLAEAEKSLSRCERELKGSNSERSLFRVQWKEEKDKSAALIKEVDDLKLAIGDEQREVKRLNARLEDAQRSFQATTFIPQAQAERDSLCDSLGAEKNKVLNLTRDRDQARTERNQARTERDAAMSQRTTDINARLLADKKLNDLIECVDDYDACRQCGWGFGCWLEDDGDRVLMRCDRCRTRHWYD